MWKDKYAIVWVNIANIFEDSQKIPFKNAYLGAYESLVKAAKLLKEGQTQHRESIQKELIGKLQDARKDFQKTQAIRDYEDAYANGRKNGWAELKIKLMTALAGTNAECTIVKKSDTYYIVNLKAAIHKPSSGNSLAEKLSTPLQWGGMVTVAHVFLGTERFVDAGVKGTRNKVWAHKQTGKHFVQDKFDRFIRRYQTRAINDRDLEAIKAGKGIKANMTGSDVHKATNKEANGYKGYAKGDVLSEADEVFFQLQQGSQRFLSITSTKHKIFGNGGDSFINYGLISVDLALVAKDLIIDVHDPESIMAVLGLSKETVSGSIGNKNPTESQKAARDTIRTREILVRGAIPIEAIAAFGKDADDTDFTHPVYPVNPMQPWI